MIIYGNHCLLYILEGYIMKTKKSKTLQNQGVYINKKLTEKERYRKIILESYIRRKLRRKDAIKRLQLSDVQFKRILKRYRRDGDSGLKHKLINQPSNHAISDEFIAKVIKLYRTKYYDFSYVFASEKLLELDNIEVTNTNLRRWLLKSGVSAPQHKYKTYFKKRLPRSRFGELVQVDGTFHDWFEDGNMYCIIHFVDDATKTSLAMMFKGETTLGAMQVLKRWCELYGCPESLYMDKHSVYKIHDKNQKLALDEELAGQKEILTNFGKVCDKLGIKLIFANTPQAKGRVERRHAVLQDRLVKEFRLRNIKTIENANKYILEKDGFLEQINIKFTVPAADSNSVCVRFTQTELERMIYNRRASYRKERLYCIF